MQDKGQLKLFLVAAASIIALDQLTKLWVRSNSALLPPSGESFLNLVYRENTGSIFGLLPGQVFLLIITTVIVLVAILLVRHYLLSTALSNVSLGLLFGGATGNLIDRLRFGYVVDFVDLRLWNDFHWPAFNFADAAIVAGILLFIYSFYRIELFARVYHHGRTPKG
ncbi:Lipoprotein signal peptidase [subsurface metagenome]